MEALVKEAREGRGEGIKKERVPQQKGKLVFIKIQKLCASKDTIKE